MLLCILHSHIQFNTLLSLEMDHFSVNRQLLFDRALLPKFSDTDMIELYHLRSFPQYLIDATVGKFLVQTSGLAMRSTTTNKIISAQLLRMLSSHYIEK